MKNDSLLNTKSLNFLNNAIIDDSSDEYIILSNGQEKKLKKLNIKYEKRKEGLKVDLNQEQSRLFKCERDFLRNVERKHLNKPIGIIKTESIYFPGNENHFPDIVKKIKFSWEFMDIIRDTICNYYDVANRRFILISELKGIEHIGYVTTNDILENIPDYDVLNAIKKELKNNEDFLSFLKSNIIESISQESCVEERFKFLMKELALVNRNSLRELNLYKSKFSFEQFKEGLYKQKTEFLEFSQKYILDFSSKAGNISVETGALLFLIMRFSNQVFPLLFTTIILITWYILKRKSTKLLRENIVYAKNNFDDIFKKIESSYDKYENDAMIQEARNKIEDRLNKLICHTKTFLVIITIIGVILFALSMYFIYEHI